MKTRFIILFLLVQCGLFAQGQMLRGFVYVEGGVEPVPYANIVVEGKNVGATTNFDGYFQVNKVPVGLQTITVSFLGFESKTIETRIYRNKPTTVKVYLSESTQMLNTVDLNIERAEKKVKVNTAVVTLNPKSIETFSAGGDPDLMKAIAVLPGVVTTGDQGASCIFVAVLQYKTSCCWME